MRVLLTVIFVFAATMASAQTGVYTVLGVNPNGSTYNGVFELSHQQGLWVVEWELESGESAEGYAILDGDNLTFICRAQSPDGRQGFAYGHYTRRDGKWAGKWSSPGQPSPGSETLTPSKKTREQLRQTFKTPKVSA